MSYSEDKAMQHITVNPVLNFSWQSGSLSYIFRNIVLHIQKYCPTYLEMLSYIFRNVVLHIQKYCPAYLEILSYIFRNVVLHI